MGSFTSSLSFFASVLGESSQLILLVLAFFKKLFRELKCLSAYIIFQVSRDAALLYITYEVPLTTRGARHFYAYSYWTTAFILSFLRLAIIIEICRRVLREYHAVWYFSWRILTIVAIVMLSWTIYAVMRDTHAVQSFILTAQQQLDFTSAALLLIVISIGVYYEIYISPLYRLVLIGSCIYSSVQVVDSELGRHVAIPTNSAFDFIQRFSYICMLVVWTWAVWHWGNTPSRPAEAIPQPVYDDLSPRIHDRLRGLNDQLTKLVHKH